MYSNPRHVVASLRLQVEENGAKWGHCLQYVKLDNRNVRRKKRNEKGSRGEGRHKEKKHKEEICI